MIRLLLVEDQTIVRDGLKRLLDAQPDIQVVGEAENGAVAVDRAALVQPDLVLMDVRMPVMDGVTATKLIIDRFPQIKVLILTTFDEDEYVAQAMEFGATGYLLKDTPSNDLAHAIRTVYQGYTQLSPGLLKKLSKRGHEAHSTPFPTEISPKNKLAELTPREREVLSLIATGANNQEIAEILYISNKTVKNHVSNILNRLDLRDRTQAAIFACSFLVPPTNLNPTKKYY